MSSSNLDNTNTKTVNFSIYQLIDDSDAKFVPLREYKALGIQLNTSDYRKVYTDSLTVSDHSSTFTVLDMIYEKFNIDRPSDFTGHSLSVSDVVVLRNGSDSENEAYFVDSVGFKKLDDFTPSESVEITRHRAR